MIIRACCLVLAVVLLAVPVVADDSADVHAAFDAYKNAMMAGEGDAAVNAIAQSTFDYYADVRDTALYGDETQVKALGTVDLLMVLMLRTRMEPAQLEGMSGEGLVRHAIVEGWVGKNSAAGLTIGDVTVDGNRADAVIITNDQPSDLLMTFAKEKGNWKLDLVSMMALAESALEMLIGTGEQRIAGLGALMQQINGEPLGPEAWQPMIPGGKKTGK